MSKNTKLIKSAHRYYVKGLVGQVDNEGNAIIPLGLREYVRLMARDGYHRAQVWLDAKGLKSGSLAGSAIATAGPSRTARRGGVKYLAPIAKPAYVEEPEVVMAPPPPKAKRAAKKATTADLAPAQAPKVTRRAKGQEIAVAL